MVGLLLFSKVLLPGKVSDYLRGAVEKLIYSSSLPIYLPSRYRYIAQKAAGNTLQNCLTKIYESYHGDVIIGKISNPTNPRYRQDCANYLSQANGFVNSWSSIIPWTQELRIQAKVYYELMAQTLGIKSGLGTMFNRQNISCMQCRSRQRLDMYNEHLFHCSGRTKAHHAAVGEILRMCRQAGIVAIREPVGYMVDPNRRPDLVLCNYRGNNKPTLVDFTSISALSVDVIHRSWKSQGFAVQKAIQDKKVRYADAYDSSEYNFAPIGWRLVDDRARSLCSL
mmetsp:Transcript_18905/g.23061  ORF Transcript_18905/g.23061 Transcript_18905/m.23061 type:complete len:281 (+) Transcript_18905:1184-2026(+)